MRDEKCTTVLHGTQADRVNANGVKFTKECLIAAVEKFKQELTVADVSDHPLFAKVFLGEEGKFKDYCGDVESIELDEDDTIRATVLLHATPPGNLLKDLLSNKLEVGLACTYQVAEDGLHEEDGITIVDEAYITGTTVIPKKDLA